MLRKPPYKTTKTAGQYHRIFTTLNCRFDHEKNFSARQVNISAGGAAFLFSGDTKYNFVVGSYIDFIFELDNRLFSTQSVVIRFEIRQDKKKLASISFVDLDEIARKSIDDYIFRMGGYKSHDKQKRKQYLTWYSPELLLQDDTANDSQAAVDNMQAIADSLEYDGDLVDTLLSDIGHFN